MSNYQHYSARTSAPNDAYSDSQVRIWHTVTFLNNGVEDSAELYATDPMDAIHMLRLRHEED